MLEGCTLKCWGDNSNGQLGYGDKDARGAALSDMGENLPPIDLGPNRCAVAVALGAGHSCALLDNGAMKCWGGNSSNQLGKQGGSLGDDPFEMGDNLTEIDLGTGRSAVAISAGASFSCAILDNNAVKCWGTNTFKQLGTAGLTSDEFGDEIPAVDLGPTFVPIQIASSGWANHVCVISVGGELHCWGANGACQLGRDAEASLAADGVAIPLGTGRHATSVAVGEIHTCALLDNGAVKCWGYGQYGQLGYETSQTQGCASTSPVQELAAVDLGVGVEAVGITAGRYFTCALLADGSVKCWGTNTAGQLGQGHSESFVGDEPGEMGNNLPHTDVGNINVEAISSGRAHTIALLADGSLKSWGANSVGQLGLGHPNNVGTAPSHMGANLPTIQVGGYAVQMSSRGSLCQLGLFGTTTCSACSAGTWSVAGATTAMDCIPCPRGHYGAANGLTYCSRCGLASYSDELGMTSCRPCATGKFARSVGATSADMCLPPAAHYVAQHSNDKLALRVDDEEADETYFFVDADGKLRVQTNTFEEATETLVVSGTSRFRGDLLLDDSSSPLTAVLDQKVTHTQQGVLAQSGKSTMHWVDDMWSADGQLVEERHQPCGACCAWDGACAFICDQPAQRTTSFAGTTCVVHRTNNCKHFG